MSLGGMLLLWLCVLYPAQCDAQHRLVKDIANDAERNAKYWALIAKVDEWWVQWMTAEGNAKLAWEAMELSGNE